MNKLDPATDAILGLGLYPDLQTVRRIDNFLAKSWGIDFFHHELEYFNRFSKYHSKIAKFFKLQEKTAKRIHAGRYADERPLMEAMADYHVNAAISSTKRASIIDEISLTCGIISKLAITDQILDVGTHTGVIPSAINQIHKNRVTGIDPVAAAIMTARKQCREQSEIEFSVNRLPVKPAIQYGLVLCFDVLQHIDGTILPECVGSLANSIREGGVVIISTSHFGDPMKCERLAELFALNDLGLLVCDILGGYQGIPPEFKQVPVVVLIKGKRPRFDHNDVADAVSRWKTEFPSYADDSSVLEREKTRAFQKAQKGPIAT